MHSIAGDANKECVQWGGRREQTGGWDSHGTGLIVNQWRMERREMEGRKERSNVEMLILSWRFGSTFHGSNTQ